VIPSATNAAINVEVFFQVSYVSSALLSHIRDKFGQLTTRGDIGHPVSLLSASELSVLLGDRNLGVKSEDEVIDALSTWLQINMDRIDERVIVDDIFK
jgi:hypothetical protein